MKNEYVKLVVFVPLDAAGSVRHAMTQAGAGRIGGYEGCSFSSKGVGRFTGGAGTNPAIGTQGVAEAVEEERIEMRMERALLKSVITAMKSAHPYEEVAYDIYALEAPPE